MGVTKVAAFGTGLHRACGFIGSFTTIDFATDFGMEMLCQKGPCYLAHLVWNLVFAYGDAIPSGVCLYIPSGDALSKRPLLIPSVKKAQFSSLLCSFALFFLPVALLHLSFPFLLSLCSFFLALSLCSGSALHVQAVEGACAVAWSAAFVLSLLDLSHGGTIL
ncbi:hypothetical protein U1Q18_000929 [Sarracenia purpurea var. burkii]